MSDRLTLHGGNVALDQFVASDVRDKRAIIALNRAKRNMRVQVLDRRAIRVPCKSGAEGGIASVVHRVLCASNNRKKVRELTSILQRVSGAVVVTPADLGIRLEVEEIGSSFAENATLKAETFLRASGELTVADDSGLVVDALRGAPGVYSARYGGAGRSDDDRNELVLANLHDVPDEARTARFVCAIAVAVHGTETKIFEGTVEGAITRHAIGGYGFGYDPIFYYAPFERTFGQVDADLKATVSHRGNALRQAAPYLCSFLADDIIEEY